MVRTNFFLTQRGLNSLVKWIFVTFILSTIASETNTTDTKLNKCRGKIAPTIKHGFSLLLILFTVIGRHRLCVDLNDQFSI